MARRRRRIMRPSMIEQVSVPTSFEFIGGPRDGDVQPYQGPEAFIVLDRPPYASVYFPRACDLEANRVPVRGDYAGICEYTIIESDDGFRRYAFGEIILNSHGPDTGDEAHAKPE